MRVLIVDDEPAVRRALQRALVQAGHEVEAVDGGPAALARLRSATAGAPVDAVVLDVLMPDVDGLEVTRRLRAAGSSVPILLLTAQDAVANRVAGLDAGADDYLVKPFALEELLARVRALLRRRGDAGTERVLAFAGLSLDTETLEAARDQRPLALTRTELALLELFLAHPRQVLARGQILEAVWGDAFAATTNALEVYVGYLRRKTEAGGEPRLIHTVRGLGYALREASP